MSQWAQRQGKSVTAYTRVSQLTAYTGRMIVAVEEALTDGLAVANSQVDVLFDGALIADLRASIHISGRHSRHI